jgi:hypothetical protein
VGVMIMKCYIVVGLGVLADVRDMEPWHGDICCFCGECLACNGDGLCREMGGQHHWSVYFDTMDQADMFVYERTVDEVMDVVTDDEYNDYVKSVVEGAHAD